MPVVFSSPNFFLVAHFKALLETQGIPSRIRNEYLGGGAGKLPAFDCWPELLVEPRWEETACKLIRQAQTGANQAPAWSCPACGERIEGQFTGCWNCGHEI